MLDRIKLALRYKTALFDDELYIYINKCSYDLQRIGVDIEKIQESDDNIVALMIAYCKYQLNYQEQGERWEKIYNDLLVSFALDSNYK